MSPMFRALTSAAPLALLAGAAIAQPIPGNSLPQPIAIPDVPAPKDVPYPGGTIQLAVDATDIAHGVYHATETIPVVSAGAMTLLYPQWLPGTHAPAGPIEKLAGLVITADGKTIPWSRDPVDVYAFHIDVPAGTKAITASFNFLTPTSDKNGGSTIDGNGSRVLATPDMLALEWDSVSLYPAGYYVRQIPFAVTATYPKGWKSATALIPGLSGDTVTYPTINYEDLVDSPAIAGRNMRSDELAPGVHLDIAADRPDQLVATPEQIDKHKQLVVQAIKLFGAQHYDHYDFLLTLSDTLGGEGLEHHRSSEDGSDADYFTDWDGNLDNRNLLPHEYTHSWDGKFRRPADLWTPDYRTPQQDTLLWVYEGQTQYWGYVLQARSGLVSKQDTLDQLAGIAAYYQNQPGRQWRPVEDTTHDPIMAQRRAIGWRNYQRSEDYYEEGQLVWLDADQLIREKTGGKKSLDDFARAFFGIRDRDFGVVTYRFDDIVAALNGVLPYDWATFLKERIYDVRPQAPLDWITRGGYKLTYTEKPTAAWKSSEGRAKITDFSYSLGLTLGKDNAIVAVQWGGPAFKAGIASNAKLVAINGRAADPDLLKVAITAAKGGTQPIHLLIRQSDQYRDVAVSWNGGLRYPTFEKIGKGEGGLDQLLAPKK